MNDLFLTNLMKTYFYYVNAMIIENEMSFILNYAIYFDFTG
jgi:hypothetical protein